MDPRTVKVEVMAQMKPHLYKFLIFMRDIWIYFKTGHGTYLAFLLSMVNFVTIQYRLVISNIPPLQTLIPSLGTFVIFFGVTYIPLAIIFGIFEYKKGETRRKPKLNPYSQDILKAELSMLDGHIAVAQQLDNQDALKRYQYAKEVKSKWRKS